MESPKKLGLMFRFLRLLGLNYSEQEYGEVSFFQVIKKTYRTYRNSFLIKFFMESWLFSPIAARKLRPTILRKIGCVVGKDVFIGAHVYIDSGYSNHIIIEDHVHVTARCLLLCHQRDMSNYYIGDDAAKLKYKIGKIHLKKGCMIGMDTIILPGVTIGEGAIVGAGSLVSRDIPAWTIATGRPAKVVKNLTVRNTKENLENGV